MFTLRNLVDSTVTRRNPWEFHPTCVWESKSQQISMLQDVSTEHLVFSGTEGLDPHQRVGETNPPRIIHYIVVDYDTNLPSLDAEWAQNCRVAKPQWLSRTIRGGARLVYQLAEPIQVYSSQVYERFMREAMQRLNLKSIFAGLDESALKSPFTYYDVGADWVQVSEEQINTSATWTWMQKAGNNVGSFSGIEIPLDVVAEEANRMFPGRWTSTWTEGSRGLRFWDEMADNPTACMIRKTGCQCFTGPKPFVLWSEIFGRQFVAKYEEDRIGGAIVPCFWDHNNGKFWLKMEDGRYQKRTTDDIRRYLKTVPKLSGNVPKNDTCSEVDMAIITIQSMKTIDAVAPMLYREPGIHTVHGDKILNSSTSKPMQPSPEIGEWGEHFPWLAEYFEAFFDTETQLYVFFGWLHRAYVNAINMTPAQGQALFLAGPTETGKTLLSTFILPQIFGAKSADPLKSMLGTTGFNGELFEAPIWAIDDASPTADAHSRKMYSAKLKSAVANRMHSSEHKGRTPISVEWVGRIVVTCNLDPESIQVLPDLDMNNRDKVILLRVGERAQGILQANQEDEDERLNFQRVLTERILCELPHFCAWLTQFKLPKDLWGDSRYGVKSFHHPELIAAVEDNSTSIGTAEILVLWACEQKGKEEFELNATELLSLMRSCSRLDNLLRDATREAFGRRLNSLVLQSSFPLDKRRKKFIINVQAIQQWAIDNQ